MEEKINQCPNPFCKLPMVTLKVNKKVHEWHCTACGTSVDTKGARHFKRHVERHIDQGHVSDESGYVITKEGTNGQSTS